MRSLTTNGPTLVVAVACGVLLGAFACSGSDGGRGPLDSSDGAADSSDSDSSDSGSSDSAGASGGAASGGSSSPINPNNNACGLATRGAGGDSSLQPPAEFEECATRAVVADTVRSDIFLLVDQSTSMDRLVGTLDGAPTRWEALTEALRGFLTSPRAEGLRVGLQYFGLNRPGTGEVSCDADTYATADVEIAELPGNAEALTASLASHYPSNLTPSVPALEGALRYAKSWAVEHPERPTILVFATDGYPTECEQTDITYLEELAAEFANPTDGSPRVPTFVIGIGQVANLKRVAAAGGTGQAFFVANCATAAADLTATLERIANSPTICEFELPTAAEGEVVDYGKVNVTFTPEATGLAEPLYRVGTTSSCSTKGGWYYDNSLAPTKVIVCPETCRQLGAGVVDLVLGCETLSIQ